MSTALLARGQRFEHRSDWLAARREGIGASEAAAVLGVSPYQSPLEVYLHKTGHAPEAEENEAMRLGNLLEPIVAAEYRRRNGVEIEEQVFLRHEDHPWMLATLDGVRPDGTIVELKTTGWRSAQDWGEEGSDEIPIAYLCQVHHQLAVSGADAADVLVLIGGQEFRQYRIGRRDDVIADLVEIEQDFWEDVVARRPPTGARLQPGDHRIMHLIQPDIDAAIGLSPEDASVIEAWLAAKARRPELEREIDGLRTAVLDTLGPFTSGKLPDGRIVTRKTIEVAGSVIERKPYSYSDLRVRKAQS